MLREAEAEEVRNRLLAESLRTALKHAMNGSGEPSTKPRLNLRRRPAEPVEPKSMLRTAIAVLSEQHQPMHIIDLVNLVSKRRGKLTPRTSLESVLAIAAKDGKLGLKRTAPGTFEVSK